MRRHEPIATRGETCTPFAFDSDVNCLPKPAFPAELILFISGSYEGLNRRKVLDVDQPAVRFFRQGTRTNLVSWFRIGIGGWKNNKAADSRDAVKVLPLSARFLNPRRVALRLTAADRGEA
jgi:hypothetical protein